MKSNSSNMLPHIKQVFLSVLLIGTFSQALSQQNEPAPADKSGPIFKNGEAQEVPAFSNPDEWIKEELWVETRFDSDEDGKPDRMHVYVTRPAQTEMEKLKLPVIYMTSPYYGLTIWSMISSNSKKYFWDVEHELGETPKPHKIPKRKTREKRPMLSASAERTWIPRGYIMVFSSSPGTGLSDGAPTVGGENESLAPKAVIDWLCGRAKGYKSRTGNETVEAYWSSGKVGMTGTSYDGTLCLAAATTGVEGLEAIIPVAPVSSYYHYYRSNGLVRSPGGYVGEDMDVLYDFINCGDKSKRADNNARIRERVLLENQDRITGDYNDFWAGRDYLKKLDNMNVPMLMAHGFNDWNVMPEHSYRFYKAVKEKGVPTQLYYHQGGHGGDPPIKMMNRWFTRYLHGVDNEVEKDPPVQIVREDDYKPTSYQAYPDLDASGVALYLKNGNGQTGQLQATKAENQEPKKLLDDYSIEGGELVKEENSAHRLLYTTPILEEDLRLSGVAQLSIRLSCNKPAANLSVWLVSLPWNEEKGTMIYENVITRGWADPQNHASISQGEALVPGEFYELNFDLIPDDQVIPKGQQIGLMIFSSDKAFTLWPAPGTELTIDPNKTHITLPVVGGMKKYEQAVKK